MGWKCRRAKILAKKPEKHEVRIFAGDSLETLEPMKTITLATLHCDFCNCPLPDGSPAFAITDWQESREGEPLGTGVRAMKRKLSLLEVVIFLALLGLWSAFV